MLGKQLFTETKVRSVTVPVSMKEIGSHAFYKCKSLEVIQFEKGSELKTIGDSAFN